jgi:hypothetical protein
VKGHTLRPCEKKTLAGFVFGNVKGVPEDLAEKTARAGFCFQHGKVKGP